MTITVLSDADLPAVHALLEASRLPTSDLAEARPTFLGVQAAGLNGVVGIEVHGRYGLLRSLAVRESSRGQGLGTQLAQAAEQWASAQGIEELYLLTTTAEPFFADREYAVQSRDEVPAPIRATTEFSMACPASATVMRRRLA